MQDKIVKVDLRNTYKEDMARYSIYVLYDRYVPDIRDGLKPVQRRILTGMYYDIKCTSLSSKRKSANTVGSVIGKYHPHSDCIHADTKIYMLDGSIKTVGELYNAGITTFEALGVNPHTLKVEPVIVHDLRIGQYTDKIYHIRLSNGAELKCTSNHPIMLRNGVYVKAEDIEPLMILYTKILNVESNDSLAVVDVYTDDVNQVPMYDFTVDTTSNMLIPMDGNECVNTMICIHNSSVYDAMKPLANWFETKCPLLTYDSASGSIQGGPQAAMRYTESCISTFGMECVIGELQESTKIVDWDTTFDNHSVEPKSLPVKVPLLLVNGSFAIAIGRKIEVPSHSLNDVIDATLTLIENPNAQIVLIPDPCMPCELVDTNWKKISNMGYGNYIVRGIVDTIKDEKGRDCLCIKSTPDLVFSDSIKEKIEDLIKNNKIIQIQDIQDHSTESQLDLRLILKPGSDPEFVKQVVYKNTALQDTKRVNMEVLNGLSLERYSYKAYLLYFLEYRRNVKFRLYSDKLQKAETKLHEMDTYIKILESGDVENIIHAIRNQNPKEESALVQWLMKKLKITDVQAKFVLNIEIKKLSKAHLNKYKVTQKELLNKVNTYIMYLTNDKLIDEDIKKELLEIKQKYGQPRKSIIISENEANNIVSGEFKIVITEQNYIKKLQINDPIKPYKGDNAKFVLIADNAKDLIIFDQLGKSFKLPVSKISFTEKNSAGTDIRLLIKKLTSNIISVMYLPIVEMLANKTSKYYLAIVSHKGLIKRIDLDDVVNSNASGLVYTKLNDGDVVQDIIIVNNKSDIAVYTRSKALRMPVLSIPHLKRPTTGSTAMNTNDTIDGMSVITGDTTDIVVVTTKGKFNRFNASGLERKDRYKKGDTVIKLSRGDSIKGIFSCNKNSILRVVLATEVIEIPISNIPIGSSISEGVKMCSEIIKVDLIATK